MKETLQPGISGEVRERVVSKHLVSARDPQLMPVLATPWMLGFMEHAAFDAIQPHLDDNEQSVGVGFNFEHLAATPAGATVTAKATVLSIDRRKVTFEIEARDEHQVIGRGTHVRAVVDIERFKRRLRRTE